jgi:hypothetical protein
MNKGHIGSSAFRFRPLARKLGFARLLGRCTMNWAVQACFVTIAFEESRQTSGLSRPHALSVALQSAEKFPWNVLGAC